MFITPDHSYLGFCFLDSTMFSCLLTDGCLGQIGASFMRSGQERMQIAINEWDRRYTGVNEYFFEAKLWSRDAIRSIERD